MKCVSGRAGKPYRQGRVVTVSIHAKGPGEVLPGGRPRGKRDLDYREPPSLTAAWNLQENAICGPPAPLRDRGVPYDPGPGRVRAGPGSRSLSPRAARYLPSTAAMKPSGSTRLIVSELTLLLRNSVLGCREV